MRASQKTQTMKAINLRYLIIGLAMLAAAGLALALTPHVKVADLGPKVNLETMIPKQFGDWHVDESIVPLQISPDLAAALNKVYNQTLARTYINTKGERIMLSIAYGSDQSDNVQIHLPEGCYRGQGFAVGPKTKAILYTRFGKIPVARLEASKDERLEPIIYWVVVGGRVATDTWGMKLAKLRYSMRGEIAEGMLIRMSTINIAAKQSYEVQRDFADAMLGAIAPEMRARLLGNHT